MIEWILIVMLFNDGRAIGTVPGFKSEANCNYAAQRVEANDVRGYATGRVVAVCVPR